MTASDVLAVIAATLVAILCGVLVAMLLSLARTLRDLRGAVHELREETVELLDAAYEAVQSAAGEVDRVDRLVISAERIDGAVDSAYRKLSAPMVKVMAFGTGVSRAAHRLREGEPPAARRRRKRAS